MPEFTIRARKFKNNPLLKRKQFVLDIIHPQSGGVSKHDLSQKLASMYKVKDHKQIHIFGLKHNFGGGRTSGFGLIYDSIDAVKKFEMPYRQRRCGLLAAKTGITRRGKKDQKKRIKKSRGKARTKAKAGGK